MKILIVDDTHTKVQRIAEAIEKSQVTPQLIHETSVASARIRLREEYVDLLLIDLNLPDAAGFPPTPDGGLKFFNLILSDSKTRLPGEILFVTSEDSLVDEWRRKIQEHGSSLCVISPMNGEWMDVLVGQIKVAERRAARRTPRFDVAMITALGTPELDAVLALDYGWTSFRLEGDPTLYHKGSFLSGSDRRSIVAASALRKGMAASAALATKLVLNFQPKLLAMTGICAGIKGKTNLGDVIVGDPTWDWGSGKHAESEDGSVVFKLSPRQRELNVTLANLSDEIDRSLDFKRRVRLNWNKKFPEGEFKCHVGPMASGASVVAHASTAEEIANQNRDLIGIEMEAFAVMVACEYATTSSLLGIAIKSVCDFADKDKQDGWQPYASYTSAMFADEMFKRYFAGN